jgi:hypothetical protein
MWFTAERNADAHPRAQMVRSTAKQQGIQAPDAPPPRFARSDMRS